MKPIGRIPPHLPLRRIRAEALLHAVIRQVDSLMPDDTRSEVYNRMLDVFMQEGVEVLTDYDRAKMEMPPRGPDGWTHQEIVVLEKLRLDALYNPPPMMVLDPRTGEVKKFDEDPLRRKEAGL